jgi:nucleoside-diphosphate-sugar epimerase
MPQTWFLTGALGCIGAWVVKQVLERGDRPVVFDLGGDPRRIRDITEPEQFEKIRFVPGDITDLKAVRSAMEGEGSTRVIHLAGLQVPFCKADPAAGAKVNVLGTIHILQAAADLGLERVVYASSAAVYGPYDGDEPPDENAPTEPSTHYGVFKRANEGNARIFFLDRGLSSVGLRPLTVYGVGRDQGLTSGPTTAMKAAVLRRPYTVPFRGATDFIHVSDTAAAFLAAAERAPKGAHVYNLHGDSVEVEHILATIRDLDPEGGAQLSLTGSPLAIPPAISSTTLTRDLGPLPHTPLRQGIANTLSHFRHLATTNRLDIRDLP